MAPLLLVADVEASRGKVGAKRLQIGGLLGHEHFVTHQFNHSSIIYSIRSFVCKLEQHKG